LKIKTTVCRSALELEPYTEHIDSLSEQTLEPNPFYESWMLLPALRYLDSHDVLVVLVWQSEDLLAGVFPLKVHRKMRTLSFNYLSLWRYIHCFLCTPLVHTEFARECLKTFLEFTTENFKATPLLKLEMLYSDGAVSQLLLNLFKSHEFKYLQANLMTRGFLELDSHTTNQNTFSQLSLARRAEKSSRRLENHHGYTFDDLTTAEESKVWISDFIELEAKGWKGESGGAIACNASDRSFFEESLFEGARRGRVLATRIQSKDNNIAMQWMLRSGLSGFGFKTTYDQEFASYSPGLILAYSTTKNHLAEQSLQFIDSCSAPDDIHAQLWQSNTSLTSLTVSNVKAPTGRLLLRILRAKRAFQNLINRG